MATRTILSPGVEIRETDLSLIAPANVGTNVFITGYANQGPTDEVIQITTRADLDQIYGTPTNAAERYFYHGVRELLNSPANILTYRLPYGEGSGVGFGSFFSLLAYPVQTFNASLSTVEEDLTGINDPLSAGGCYVLGKPIHINLTEEEYFELVNGSLFSWSTSGSTRTALISNAQHSLSTLGNAGIIVINQSQTTINSQFEGFYLGLADNSNINPASPFNAIIDIDTVSVSAKVTSDFTAVPRGTLVFQLTSTADSGTTGSVSQVMENLTDYNIDGREDDDLLNVGIFKIRKALYATEAFKLDYFLDEKVVGSIDTFRTRPNQQGGPFVSFFLENEDENSRNVEILVNPYMSNKFGSTAVGIDGIPRKKIRILTNALSATDPSLTGITALSVYPVLYSALDLADQLFPIGSYSNDQLTTRVLGSIPSKVERALDAVKNDELYDIDLVVEAGLGTIWTTTQSEDLDYYDDTASFPAIDSLRDTSALGTAGKDVRGDYSTIFNIFENFCNLPSNTGGRGDCMFIADPIRHILVTGKKTKILDDKTKNFSRDVYWAMRHQFELENTSYAAVYANWANVFDEFIGDKVWVPFSSIAAATYARSDAAEFPWSAPAGYTRGLVSGSVVDIAITPNQKQRDELYKSSLNPVLFSPSQGIAIFGQKTLSRKPSAFDRVNVRRCFLSLERPTKKVSIFFVFEPNNTFTRTRFVNTLVPLFEFAKNNGGIFDYLIICDERNNTPQVIDNNELRADIFIKPTRTAEFVLVNFIATRTDANFAELIGAV